MNKEESVQSKAENNAEKKPEQEIQPTQSLTPEQIADQKLEQKIGEIFEKKKGLKNRKISNDKYKTIC